MDGSSEGLDAAVLIVGGGPVGMGLAIELGPARRRAASWSSATRQPQPIPKGQNLTQRTMEHFHFWGAETELRAARTIPPEYGIGGMTAYGTLLGPYTTTGCSASWCGRSTSRTTSACRNTRPKRCCATASPHCPA